MIACAILFYMALNYLDMVKQGVTSLFRILGPFIWGLVIVYLLLPLVRFLQRNGLKFFLRIRGLLRKSCLN